jgi:hypothetical protein
MTLYSYTLTRSQVAREIFVRPPDVICLHATECIYIPIRQLKAKQQARNFECAAYVTMYARH